MFGCFDGVCPNNFQTGVFIEGYCWLHFVECFFNANIDG